MNKLEYPWSNRFVIDPNTGKTFYKYFYKRKPAYRIEICTPTAKALAGYALIEKDVRSALFWLNSIIKILKDDKNWAESKIHHKSSSDREQMNLVKGLFVAALTFYGKCFSQCKGRRIKLEVSNLDKEFHDDHELAMMFRHNFAAHSGAELLEYTQIIVALDKKKKSLPHFSIDLMQPDVMAADNIYDFVKLFEHAKAFTDKKIEVLTLKVKEYIVSKGSEYWYKKTPASKAITVMKSKW